MGKMLCMLNVLYVWSSYDWAGVSINPPSNATEYLKFLPLFYKGGTWGLVKLRNMLRSHSHLLQSGRAGIRTEVSLM